MGERKKGEKRKRKKKRKRVNTGREMVGEENKDGRSMAIGEERMKKFCGTRWRKEGRGKK